jgi:hypothetical protein
LFKIKICFNYRIPNRGNQAVSHKVNSMFVFLMTSIEWKDKGDQKTYEFVMFCTQIIEFESTNSVLNYQNNHIIRIYYYIIILKNQG